MGIVYSKTKIFHFKEKLDSLPVSSRKILAPVHIRIKPTNICCHKCKYCAYGQGNLKVFGKNKVERVSIPKEKMMEIIDDVIDMGVRAVTFSGGGEPFVYPYLLDVVRRLSESEVKFSSLTNGSLLQGELARIFAMHGSWIRVSMDGWDDKSYSSYRGVSDGEFTKIITNMKNFKKLKGKCYLGVSLIVDEANAPRVYDILKQLKESRVDSVKISPCLINDRAADNNNYHAPLFDKVKKQVEKARNDFAEEGFEIFNAYAALDEKFEKDYSWCPYLQILPIIGADLNIYACPDKAYNLEDGVVGSIKDRRLKDFWFSDKNNFFRINPSVHCAHHCETNSKNKIVLEYLNADKEHLNFV